jgi:hypothetical protein
MRHESARTKGLSFTRCMNENLVFVFLIGFDSLEQCSCVALTAFVE